MMRVSVAAMLLAIAACSGAPAVCDSKSCQGCCSPNAECHFGDSTDFCGTAGLACVTCAADQLCRLNTCQVTTTDSGTRSDAGPMRLDAGPTQVTDGGAPAQPDGGIPDAGIPDAGTPDAGDLADAAVVTDGGSPDAGAADAGVSDAGVTTDAGAPVDAGIPPPSCTSSNCDGCCSGTVCRRGDSAGFCGVHGAVCIECGDGLTCNGGACQLPACSPSSCPNGCCQNNLCVTPSSTACGTAGQICAACTDGKVCEQGTCVNKTCGLTTCPGCCENNSCVSPVRPNACGFSGNACTNCADGQSCGNGTCGLTGNRYAGSPCTKKDDCQISGVFGGCNSGSEWPGGYCQDTCYLLPCHSPDLCVNNSCYERCAKPRQGQDTCRGGYVCESSQSDGGLSEPGRCVPDCHHRGCTVGSCNSEGYCG